MGDQSTPAVKKRRTGSAPPGFERISTLAARIGFAPTTIQSWVANPDLQFPKPTKLGARVSIYSIAAVNAWMASRGLTPAPTRGAA